MVLETPTKTETDQDLVLEAALLLEPVLEHLQDIYDPMSSYVSDEFPEYKQPEWTIEIDRQKHQRLRDKLKGAIGEYYELLVEDLEEFGKRCLCTLNHPSLAFVHDPRFRPCYHGAPTKDVPTAALYILELQRGLDRLPYPDRARLSQKDQITILHLLEQLEQTDVQYRTLRTILRRLNKQYERFVRGCEPFAEDASYRSREPSGK